jgi:hypothetical protein
MPTLRVRLLPSLAALLVAAALAPPLLGACLNDHLAEVPVSILILVNEPAGGSSAGSDDARRSCLNSYSGE